MPIAHMEIVLKIMYPNLKVTLVDATEKKCNFLKMVIDKLNLKNIEVINARAEDYSKNNRELYDIVTSRAVAPLKHLLEYSIPLVKVNGTYIAMKSDLTKELEKIENYEHKLNIYFFVLLIKHLSLFLLVIMLLILKFYLLL
mgnify:CR=1 FL=1